MNANKYAELIREFGEFVGKQQQMSKKPVSIHTPYSWSRGERFKIEMLGVCPSIRII